jgi:hypothetical protein
MGGIASGGAGGGGGLSTSSSSSATSGDARGQSGSGNKQFNFGANPNASRATTALENTLANPFVILGALGIIWLMTRSRKRR